MWQTLAMDVLTERDLLDAAFAAFSELVAGEGMEVGRRPLPGTGGDNARDDVWSLQASSYHNELIVQAFNRFSPRDADRVLSGVSGVLRRLRDSPILIVAPWLSPRSRELLVEQGLNYLDLTGSAWIRIERPLIRIRISGAPQDPHPPVRRPVRLQGKNINALVRALVDVRPPYRMVDLARFTGLSNAYVSRTLEALDDERLVERDAKRVVTDVDWAALLRSRAEQYDLVRSNHGQGFIARGGAQQLYRRLAEADDDQALVTGSFAAAERVQLAPPTQLALYVQRIADAVESLGLMPAQTGANVLLLRAADPSQLIRAERGSDGGSSVGISQLVQDCLAGNGRLPEEGDTLLEWMSDETKWRMSRLPVQ